MLYLLPAVFVYFFKLVVQARDILCGICEWVEVNLMHRLSAHVLFRGEMVCCVLWLLSCRVVSENLIWIRQLLSWLCVWVSSDSIDGSWLPVPGRSKSRVNLSLQQVHVLFCLCLHVCKLYCVESYLWGQTLSSCRSMIFTCVTMTDSLILCLMDYVFSLWMSFLFVWTDWCLCSETRLFVFDGLMSSLFWRLMCYNNGILSLILQYHHGFQNETVAVFN